MLKIESEMRALVRGALPGKAFLRFDRGDALYLSDAPGLGDEDDMYRIPGFACEREGKLLRIFPEKSWLTRAEEDAAPGSFAASLSRFRGLEPDDEALSLFRAGLKCRTTADVRRFDRLLRRRAALALRGAVPPGGLYPLALLDEALETCYNDLKA